ncbi:MAG: hypothetical protein M3463_23180, partial [Verrucomicrobiota bacterium]|nr:hypothetical protein [Verrucomicrobiota bacterium]
MASEFGRERLRARLDRAQHASGLELKKLVRRWFQRYCAGSVDFKSIFQPRGDQDARLLTGAKADASGLGGQRRDFMDLDLR